MTESSLKFPIKCTSCPIFGVSPFGLYCFECKSPVGFAYEEITSDTIRMHISRSHKHPLEKGTSHTALARSFNNEIDDRFDRSTVIQEWFIPGTTTSTKSCSCGYVPKEDLYLKRHIENMAKKPGQNHFCITIESVVTTCHRTVDMAVLRGKYNSLPQRTNLTSSSQDQVHTLSSTGTPSSDNQSSSLNDILGCVPINLPKQKWISPKLEDIKLIFKDYQPLDESLDAYLPSLKLMSINSKGPIILSLTEDLTYIKNQSNSMDPKLSFFVKCVERWVKIYCREHTNLLNGKIRFDIHSFFDESILVNAGYNQSFNMRENEDVIIQEMKLMVILSWKIHRDKSCYDGSWLMLDKIFSKINEYEAKYKGIITEEGMDDIVSSLILQQYFYCIYVEEQKNAFSLLLGLRIAMTRLFMLKNVPGDDTNAQTLAIRACSEYGKTLSLHLHIYRLSTASLLVCTESQCWKHLLEKSSVSCLSHTLSPLINKTKHMHNEKLAIRDRVLSANGDITIDEYSFPKSKWCKMVPNLIQAFEQTCRYIFSGDEWRRIVDLNNNIIVHRIEDKNENEMDDRLHYNFCVNVNGKVIEEKSLEVEEDVDSDQITKLTGLVMIGLHGTGFGATRIAELYRIKQHQVYWCRSNIYYLTISNKRKSANLGNKRVVTHKLPASISRYLLLYDYIGRQRCPGRDEFLFSLQDKYIDSTYKNQHFYNEFAKLFDLSSTCGGLVMRHLYTQICNHLFPKNNNNDLEQTSVSAVGVVAEMSGHSEETHDKFYDSTIDKERFFRKFHRSIGCTDSLNDSTPGGRVMSLATTNDALHCLRVLLGTRAYFKSGLQKELIMDAMNNHFKHTFCSISCGGGKSMSWLIPTLRQSQLGIRPKMSVVIVPYCFLLDHHLSSCKNMLGYCSGALLSSLKGNEVEEDDVPNVLRDEDSLPSILFLSLEALSNLTEYHFDHLQKLSDKGKVYKFFVDECHTLLSELNFRRKYTSLQKIVRLKIPTMLFSGSFQKCFITKFMDYLFGSEDGNMFNDVIDSKLFGEKLVSISHMAVPTYLKECCSYVSKFVKDHVDDSVHIIVSSVNEGDRILNELKKTIESCDFIFSGSDNQANVARRWNNNNLKVLISTTIGLVGNESYKTQLLCIVGLMYDLPSMVQALGRIRPSRRTNHSKCMIFTMPENRDRLQTRMKDVDSRFDELVSAGIVLNSHKEKYLKSMTVACVNEWLFNDIGCRYVSLADRMGFDQEKCGICDSCTSTPVCRLAIAGNQGRRESITMKENGIQLLRRLRYKCIVCNETECKGDCVVKSIKGRGVVCYHCLGNHRTTQCQNYKGLLKGKACYSCYCYNYSGITSHHFTKCRERGQIMERLRCLIQSQYHPKKSQSDKDKSVFRQFIGGIYANEETFFKFLNQYKDYNSIQQLQCIQYDIDDPRTPLLPPDSQENLERVGERQMEYTCIDQARNLYNFAIELPENSLKHRKYLHGSRYRCTFESKRRLIDVRDYGGALDLNITIGGNTCSIFKIRDLSHEEESLQVIKHFNEACIKKSTARNDSGDKGKMYAFGLYKRGEVEYASMRDKTTKELSRHFSITSRKLLDKYFQREVREIIQADRDQHISALPNMGGEDGLSAYCLVSRNLINSAHYDLDKSVSITVFNEKNPGTATDWYFILPNTTLEGDVEEKSIVIQLFDGCSLCWDGTKIYHCTGTRDFGKDDNGNLNYVYGNFWGGKSY